MPRGLSSPSGPVKRSELVQSKSLQQGKLERRMTARVPLIALLVGLVAIQMRAADLGPIVASTGGRVQGEMLHEGGAVFKGIPYAQPPIGEVIQYMAHTSVRAGRSNVRGSDIILNE